MARKTSAIPRRTASPARWPYVLLISRRRSRSAMISDTGRPNRAARVSSSFSASPKWRALKRPVFGSTRASASSFGTTSDRWMFEEVGAARCREHREREVGDVEYLDVPGGRVLEPVRGVFDRRDERDE